MIEGLRVDGLRVTGLGFMVVSVHYKFCVYSVSPIMTGEVLPLAKRRQKTRYLNPKALNPQALDP